MSQIVTSDETWMHHWDPETKSESMQWVHKWPPSQKKQRPTIFRKIDGKRFRDIRGILFIEYMPKGTTIKSDNYANVLDNFGKTINAKQRSVSAAREYDGT